MNRQKTHLARPTAGHLLARILEVPELATQIQSLAPPVLARLIGEVGLEDAGELVAFATTDQLARVFDLDLWTSARAGEDDRFDARRFVLWLEVMLEAGDAFVAEKLAELPEELVTLALHEQVLVLRVADLFAEMRDAGEDADALDKALSDCLSEELDDYQIVARRQDGWDTVLTALLALDRDRHDVLARLLERCAALDEGEIADEGGLYDVLTSEQMLEGDVAAERADRRAEEGHVAPSDATAFLRLAAREATPTVGEHDPVTRAYLREVARKTTPVKAPPAKARAPHALLRVLEKAGVVEKPAPLRLGGGSGGHAGHAEPLLARAMRALAAAAPAEVAARSEELAFLANVLAAGCSLKGRRLRPVEAVRAAIEACSHGLLLTVGRNASDDAAGKALARATADGLFRLAWHRLHQDVAAGRATPPEVALAVRLVRGAPN
jgi:Family of unknown function (DUF6178)